MHDWLLTLRGGEKVLAELCSLMPDADILTLFHRPGAVGPPIEGRPIRASFLNRLPGVHRYYRHLLPLFPLAARTLDARAYDLVVSVSHCAAKAVGGRRKGQLHVCLCLTPMRYVWAVEKDYRRSLGLAGLALRALKPILAAWDRRTAARVDEFVAISHCIAERIRHAYDRPSVVLYPPADVDFYTPGNDAREDFYLLVSALTPYKRVDQAVEAFARLDRPLKIIGEGPESARLARNAPPNVQWLGWQTAEVIRDHYRRCRALIFPQLEDFGIVPVEAMACGAPVIAFGKGGATETVLDAANPAVADPTGLLYSPQTADALAAAVERFESPAMQSRFHADAIRRWAEQFSPQRFADGFKRILTPLLEKHSWPPPWEDCS